uniref:Uncharacterized protein n=1 Tax=Bionectria ochroleuca TaxID=29856 RepID=A0A8H7TS34_BIOOC
MANLGAIRLIRLEGEEDEDFESMHRTTRRLDRLGQARSSRSQISSGDRCRTAVPPASTCLACIDTQGLAGLGLGHAAFMEACHLIILAAGSRRYRDKENANKA